MRRAMKPGRAVYSTDKGRLCPACGWPLDLCRCGERREEALPDTVVAKLRLEKSGRAGKEVTVIDGLPRNAAFVEQLARALKKACGTGGTFADGRIELQGDRRERVAALLRERGIRVKGA
jgi:translation initiation factor 1